MTRSYPDIYSEVWKYHHFKENYLLFIKVTLLYSRAAITGKFVLRPVSQGRLDDIRLGTCIVMRKVRVVCHLAVLLVRWVLSV